VFIRNEGSGRPTLSATAAAYAAGGPKTRNGGFATLAQMRGRLGDDVPGKVPAHAVPAQLTNQGREPCVLVHRAVTSHSIPPTPLAKAVQSSVASRRVSLPLALIR
jgi:hypothetical protein